MGKGTQRGQGTVKRQATKQPHMTLRIEGTDRTEKLRFIKHYYGLNREGKRNLIRLQKASHVRYIKDNTKGAFGQSNGQRYFTVRMKEMLVRSELLGISLKDTIGFRNDEEFCDRMQDRKDANKN